MLILYLQFGTTHKHLSPPVCSVAYGSCWVQWRPGGAGGDPTPLPRFSPWSFCKRSAFLKGSEALASTLGKVLCDTGGCYFLRLWQGLHPADQLGCFHALPLLLFFVIYLHTLIYGSCFSALMAALLQQPVIVHHRVVYSCADTICNLCPQLSSPSLLPLASDPGTPGAKLWFRQQTPTVSWQQA